MGYSEVIEFVQENNIEFIKLMFCDITGVTKNIIISAKEVKKAFEYGISFDGSSIKGFANLEKSDLILMPDPTTINVIPYSPYEGMMVVFFCDILTPDYKPYEFDSRLILKNAVNKCLEYGFEPKIGTECEFYLFQTDEKGNPTNEPIDQGGYFDIYPLDKGEKIRREICLRMDEMGLDTETSHHENGPGQNEIDFKYSDALYAADYFLIFITIVETVAVINGLHASFLPKPLINESGNGLHINLSLTKDGLNIFNPENSNNYQCAKYFISGILNRTIEMMAFLCSTANSYQRLGEFSAPKYVSWSHQNRSQLIRIPAARKEFSRVELRVSDPVINPYIVFALVINAGLKGIENQEELVDAIDLDLYNLETNNIHLKKLPATLNDSLEIMKNSSFIKEVLGEKLVEKYYLIKKS